MLEPAPTPIKSRFPADDIYVPDITIISDETIEESKKAASSLCEAFGASPLPFQIKRKRIKDLTPGTKQIVKKFEKFKIQLEKIFAEAIAPGQSEALISQVLHTEDEDGSTQLVPEDLVVPVKMFQESDSLGQILLLSVINHNKYTKETLMKIFDCKKYQIEKARKLQKESRGFSIPKKEKVNICRMPQEKITFFRIYILSRFAARCSLWCK